MARPIRKCIRQCKTCNRYKLCCKRDLQTYINNLEKKVEQIKNKDKKDRVEYKKELKIAKKILQYGSAIGNKCVDDKEHTDCDENEVCSKPFIKDKQGNVIGKKYEGTCQTNILSDKKLPSALLGKIEGYLPTKSVGQLRQVSTSLDKERKFLTNTIELNYNKIVNDMNTIDRKRNLVPNALIVKLKDIYNFQEITTIRLTGVNETRLKEVYEKVLKHFPNLKYIYIDSDFSNLIVNWYATLNTKYFELIDKNGWTALMYASEKGHTQIAELLINKGADLNVINKEGWTALMYASRYGRIQIAELLINKGADLNVQNNDKWTALMYALRYEHPQIAELLINKGADVNVINKEGWTALMYALRYNSPQIAELLINKGADLNVQNNGKWTALMYALKYEHPQIAKLLINKGADVNLKETDGWTALMYASQNDHFQIVRLLINKGADVNVQNNYGYTALDIAKNKKYKHIIFILEQKLRQQQS